MPDAPRECRILGAHHVVPTSQDLEEALEIQWGNDLTGADLERAQQCVRDHFDGLFLIEMQFEPPDAAIDWSAITQPIENQDRSSWQAVYDERLIDPSTGRWAFFLHFVDPSRPILTQLGECWLPATTPIPAHLTKIKYEVPG